MTEEYCRKLADEGDWSLFKQHINSENYCTSVIYVGSKAPVEVVEYCWNQGLEGIFIPWVFFFAAALGGNLKVIEWADGKGLIKDNLLSSMVSGSIVGQKLHVLEWICDQKIKTQRHPPTLCTPSYIPFNYKILKYIRDYGLFPLPRDHEIFLHARSTSATLLKDYVAVDDVIEYIIEFA